MSRVSGRPCWEISLVRRGGWGSGVGRSDRVRACLTVCRYVKRRGSGWLHGDNGDETRPVRVLEGRSRGGNVFK